MFLLCTGNYRSITNKYPSLIISDPLSPHLFSPDLKQGTDKNMDWATCWVPGGGGGGSTFFEQK